MQPTRRTLVAIGNFDGVHRGHRQVLGTALELAAQRDLEPTVLTFDPHPAQVLGRTAIPQLTCVKRKVELILRIDPRIRVVVEPFTTELAQLGPREFAQGLLAERLGAALVLVGRNFRFGHQRAGDLATLTELGRGLDFEVSALELVADETGVFSSSGARAALAAGDLARVEGILGRPHAVCGRVARGDGRGRKIGFPTANLVDVCEAAAPYGVYACVVDQLDSSGVARALAHGVANIGVRPTFEAGQSTEVHLLDFDTDLYDERLRVHLIERIRPEQRFDGVEALVAQITRDVERARALLAQRRPDPDAAPAWY